MSALSSHKHSHVRRDLVRIPLFQNLAPEDIALIAHSSHRLTLAAGKPLLQLGHKSNEVYFLLEGTVKVSVPQLNGGGCIINICGPGAVLGEISAIDEAGHSANVTTVEPCRLLWMHSKTFLQHVDNIAPLNRRLLRQMAQRLRHNCQRAHDMSQFSVSKRVACLLMDFARLYEDFSTLEKRNGSFALPLPLPQKDIAATVGAARQTVNETLSDFKKEGLVAVEENQRIVILDQLGLEAHCKR